MSSSDSSGSSFLCFHCLLLSWGKWWREQDFLLEQHQLLGQVHQPYIADEAPNVDIGQTFCKQIWPERFSIYTNCFNEGTDVILRHQHCMVLQDKSQADGRQALRWRQWCGLSERCPVEGEWC